MGIGAPTPPPAEACFLGAVSVKKLMPLMSPASIRQSGRRSASEVVSQFGSGAGAGAGAATGAAMTMGRTTQSRRVRDFMVTSVWVALATLA